MTRLNAMLEPGETVAVKFPGGDRTFWVRLVGFLFVVLIAAAMATHALLGIDIFTAGAVVWGSIVLLAHADTRWLLAVTDRRVLRRHGPFLLRLEEIRLDEIEEVRTEMGSFRERIVIRAQGRETVIAMIGLDPAPVVKAIERAKGAA